MILDQIQNTSEPLPYRWSGWGKILRMASTSKMWKSAIIGSSVMMAAVIQNVLEYRWTFLLGIVTVYGMRVAIACIDRLKNSDNNATQLARDRMQFDAECDAAAQRQAADASLLELAAKHGLSVFRDAESLKIDAPNTTPAKRHLKSCQTKACQTPSVHQRRITSQQ